MSIWRSPVFYFGVILALVVSLATAAPYVIDWNGYKPELERFGERLTGRKVEIGGDVEIRLFPWPRLTAQNVRVGNPAGFAGAPLVDAQTVELQLALGGLLNGTLDVQSVEVLEPNVALIRDEQGRINWAIGPEGGLKSSTLLSQVRLDQIRMLNGSLHVEDRVQDVSANFTTVDADMSAAAIEGPWRIKGSGFWGETPLDVTFTSSPVRDEEPFKFGLRVVPRDTALPIIGLDGDWGGQGFDGNVQLDPQVASEEKGSAEGELKPLAFRARLKATPELAEFEQIRIAPADTRDSGTLIEGRASIAIGEEINSLVELNAPRVNLDTLMGAETLATVRQGGLPALVGLVLKSAPERLKADLMLDMGALTFGGETLQNVTFKATGAAGKLQISEGRAGLPGRSAMLFSGDVALKDGAPELQGRVDFESSDLRSFARWAMPQHKASIDQYWKGSRGRLKLISNIGWSEAQTRLSNLDFEFDGAPGKGEITLTGGALPALDLKLDMQALNLDDMLPGGIASFSGAKAFDALSYIAPLLAGDNGIEKRVTIDAAAITLNGQTAQDVALDFAASASGVEMKLFEIGSAGGARLTSRGLVLNGPAGPSGEFTASFSAADPRGFLQLTGFAEPGSRWADALGATTADAKLEVAPSPSGSAVAYALKGKTGPHVFDVKGDLSELERGGDARVSLSGTLQANEALPFLKVFGVEAKSAVVGIGKASFSLTGSRQDGFATRFDGEAAGAALTFDGRLKPGEAYGGVSGTANIVAQKAGVVLAILGLPVPQQDGALQLSARLLAEGATLKASQVFGNVAGSAFKGEASLDQTGRLAAELEAGDLALTDILAASLLPWDGRAAELSTTFMRPEDLPLTGAIAIRPQRLSLPFGPTLAESVIDISLGETRRIGVLVPTRPDIGMTLEIVPKDTSYEAKLSGSTVAELPRLLTLSDKSVAGAGLVTLSGTFTGVGRSPGAALSSLTGTGTYVLEDGALTQFVPGELANRIDAVKSADDLSAALKSLEGEGRFALADARGQLSAEGGTLTFSPLVIQGGGTLTTISAKGDFSANEFTFTAGVELTARPDLPQVSIGYAGIPGELTRRASTSALAAKLGHAMLAKDLDELERLRKEQETLAIKEEAQREQDVAKFEAYQAQRAELRLRTRELRVFADMREKKAKATVAAFEALLPEAEALNKVDLSKARLQLAVARNLAEFAQKRLERRQAEEEAARKAEEDRLRKAEAERAAAEKARVKALEAENRRLAEEARKKEEAEARARAEAEAAARKAEAERLAAEDAARKIEEARLKKEVEDKARRERIQELERQQEELKRKLLETEQQPNFAPPQTAPAPKPASASDGLY